MRVTVSHNKPKQEVIQRVNQAFDDVFKAAIPGGFVQIEDEKRTWVGDQMNFTFNARTPFMPIPVKGFVLVEDRQVTIDVDLPPFVSNFIPEQKMAQGIESKIKGLLT